MTEELLTRFFLKIVNMSVSAGWLVLAVLLLRPLLRRAPKWAAPALWGIVGLRLLMPFSIESALSLIPSAETVSPEIMMAREPAIDSGVPIINQAVNPVIAEHFTPNPAYSANPLQIWLFLAAAVWLIGVAAMLLYALVSWLLLKRRLRTAVRLRDNLWQSENAASPFVLGVFRPRIYLPFSLPEGDLAHVIAHEQAHIARKDHWWKPLGFLLLAVHWFNPLLWAAYVLLCRDIELACDERVVGKLAPEARADYSQALLECSVRRRLIAACPLAFGEVGVKERVKRVLHYKKPAFWVTAAAAVACAAVAVCFLTDPVRGDVEVQPSENVGAPAMTMDILREIIEKGDFENVDFAAYSNAVMDDLNDHALTYTVDFELEEQGKSYRLIVSRWKDDDSLDYVEMGKNSNGEALWLCNARGEKAEGRDLDEFLAHDYDIRDKVSWTTPAGLTETEYRADYGIAGGVLLKPDAYEPLGDPEYWSCPPEWAAAGMVSEYYTDGLIEWDGAEIGTVYQFYNHTWSEPVGPVDGLCAPAYLVKSNHDLYTVADLGRMEEQGVDTHNMETTSDYWYVWFARPGEEKGVVISLNGKNFTREDVLEFAKSVRY